MIALTVNRSHFLLSVAAWCGMLQFLVGTYWAMEVYPGGYSLGGNFLSDLGRTVSASGAANPSCVLFNVSVVILGTALLGFFVFVPAMIEERKWWIRGPGVLSAAGVVGIGLTPYDKFFGPHIVALVMWLGPMVVLLLAHLATTADTSRSAILTRLVALATILAVFGYACAGFHDGRVFMQKVTAGLAIVWFLAIASPFSPVYRTAFTYISQRRVLAERQALKYMKTLERGYRRPSEAPRPPKSKVVETN